MMLLFGVMMLAFADNLNHRYGIKAKAIKTRLVALETQQQRDRRQAVSHPWNHKLHD